MGKAKAQIKRYDSIVNGPNIQDNDPVSSDDSIASEDGDSFSNSQSLHSSLPSFTSQTSIEAELDKYDRMDRSYWNSFKLFAQSRGWNIRKKDTGFIKQNSHLQAYWKGMVHLFPRLSKIMLFVLNAPCSSSPLERFFSTISLNSSAIASRRTSEYLEELAQINPRNDDFFVLLDALFAQI